MIASSQGAITLIGPDQVEPGRQFDIAVEGLTIPLASFEDNEPPQIEWKVLPEGAATINSRLEVKIVMQGKSPSWVVSPYATIVAKEAGRIGIVLFTVQDCVGAIAVHEVTVGPFPKLDPKPDPEPVPQKLWGAILIEETSERTPELAALITSQAVRSYFRDQKLTLLIADQDATDGQDVPENLARYIKKAKDSGGLPYLFVIGDEGKILSKRKPATNPGEFVDFMKRWKEAQNAK